MWPEGFPAADYVRQARRLAGMSQRDFAKKVGVGRSTVERVETGDCPSLQLFERIVAAAGLVLVVGRPQTVAGGGLGGLVFVPPLEEFDGDCRDGARRRYPAHLPLVVDPVQGEWWGDRYGLARPPETFYRDRTLREVRRSLSQWDVRPCGPRPRSPCRSCTPPQPCSGPASRGAAAGCSRSRRAPIHASAARLARLGP